MFQGYFIKIMFFIQVQRLFIIGKNGKLKVKKGVFAKSYIDKIRNENKEPFIIIQEVNTELPWEEKEKFPTTKELKGRYSSGPSYFEIFKQYIKSIGNCRQIHRLFYYASGKVL